MEASKPNKIVLVHDSFTQLGGAERVVKVFCEMFPQAELHTLVADQQILEGVTNKSCSTTYLQNLYSAGIPFKYLLPLIPPAVGSIQIPDNSLVISSSSLFLKGLIIPKNSIHIQYIHTPPRFLWTDADYVNQEVSWWLRPFVKWYLKSLKKWDYLQAQKVNVFISNSKEVQSRVKKFYERDSDVVFPFVDTNFWKPTKSKKDYFLIGGRLQAHKHYDEFLEVFRKLEVPLKVFGSGRHEQVLKNQAHGNIEFLGRVTDLELRDLYSEARGFIFPPVEDAGIMPLEAMACGTAVLAIRKGGTLETVIEGETGEFFDTYSMEEITEKILNWDERKYLQEKLLEQAQRFNLERFKQEIMAIVEARQ